MNVGSLWESLVPPEAAYDPLTREVDADLVIVGAGFLGLSTALHATELGLEVVLLESRQPGYGASGRNTGFVVPSLKSSLGPQEVIRALGETHAQRLLKLVAGSGDLVFNLIDRHGIECGAVRNGWLQPAHSNAAEEMLHSRMPRLLDAGVAAEWLDRKVMFERTGLEALHGGIRVATGGQITPLAYALGLARAATAGGVRIFGDSPATAFENRGEGWVVRTAQGSVRTKRVIMTTNALIGNLLPELRASIILAKVFQIATQVMPREIQDRLLPDMAPVADTRRHTFALRWSPDGRLVTGGMVPPVPGRMALAHKLFANRLKRFVPGLPEVRVEYSWTGVIAGTLDFLPRLMRIRPGIDAVIGCNGRGVALTTALGREVAQWSAGQVDEGDMTLQVTPPRPIPFSGISGAAPQLILPIWEIRDAYEARFK